MSGGPAEASKLGATAAPKPWLAHALAHATSAPASADRHTTADRWNPRSFDAYAARRSNASAIGTVIWNTGKPPASALVMSGTVGLVAAWACRSVPTAITGVRSATMEGTVSASPGAPHHRIASTFFALSCAYARCPSAATNGASAVTITGR